MPPAATRRPAGPARAVRRASAASALAAAVVSVLSGWGEVPLWAVPLLGLGVAAAELGARQLQIGRQRWTFSATAAAVGAALVVGAGAWIVLSVAVGVACAQVVHRQPRPKREYDLASALLATAVAQALVGGLGGGVGVACAGMVAFWAVRHVLAAFAVAHTSRRPFRSLVVSGAARSATQTAGNASVGLLAAFLAVEAPWGLLGLLGLVVLLAASYDQQRSRGAEAQLFAELARGQERETGRSTDRSAQVVLTAAARLLGGADVELLLLSASGPVRYVGDEAGVPARERVGADVFDEPWVMQALGHRGVHAGRDAGRPCLSAVLGDPDSPLAVLRARRSSSASGFDRNEVRLTGVLVGQAESWLSVADLSARSLAATERADVADEAAKALSDLGSATTPALLVLRESADRLARLAGSEGAIDDIVEELHLVERAVASLLGAIALAAEPDLVRLAGRTAPVRRSADDWTTTGLLR